MNQLHGRFDIANEDFLYVLSTFIYEPIRWNERFGWRPLCEQERLGYFHFWRAVGRRMNIRDIPASFEAFERFNRDYERQHYRFTEANQRVGAATRELFVRWFPRRLAPLVRSAIYALLDDLLREAFGFPRGRGGHAGWSRPRCDCGPGSSASCRPGRGRAYGPSCGTALTLPATRSSGWGRRQRIDAIARSR
jgi:hypothetical protein